MATSNITVTSLTLISGRANAVLNFVVTDPNVGRYKLELDAVEIWASATNDRTAASKIGEGIGQIVETAIAQGLRYYWAKARNGYGNYGDWYPSSPTGGVSGTVYPGQIAAADSAPYQQFSDGGILMRFGADSVLANATKTITFTPAFGTVVRGLVWPTSVPGDTELYTAHVVSLSASAMEVGVRRLSGGVVDRPAMNIGFFVIGRLYV